MIRRFRIWQAQRNLDRLVKRRLASFEHQQFLKHRAAALKGMAAK